MEDPPDHIPKVRFVFVFYHALEAISILDPRQRRWSRPEYPDLVGQMLPQQLDDRLCRLHRLHLVLVADGHQGQIIVRGYWKVRRVCISVWKNGR